MPVIDVLQPHTKDLGGGFMIRRLLPSASRQAVGPFVFMDHFGPIVRRPVDDFDVRPHPHIGLATVTYLYEGAMLHRDSLGSVQRIEPGAINWMTAGRGIVHSERCPDDLRRTAGPLHGLQLWVGLPVDQEEREPAFEHTAAAALPEFDRDGVRLRILVGEGWGRLSPVTTSSPTLFIDANAAPGAVLDLPAVTAERAVYPLAAPVEADGDTIDANRLAVLAPGEPARVTFPEGGRVAIVGGAPMDGRRHMWWNFVSSSRERIEAAKVAWTAQRMGTIPGETEFIPLPER
jgi:redox-sensitive bicupin YhaK (pirin superfamily)